MRRLGPLLLVMALAAGCGSSKEDKPKATATPASAASGTPAPKARGCQKMSAPEKRTEPNLPRPALRLSPAKRYTATVKTSCGQFQIALDVERSPRTTASFVSLARKRFFNQTTFHRISPGFVIQGGDPLGTGRGGPGYSVTEPPPRGLQYTRGLVAMAKRGDEPPGSSGSQFFVVTAEATPLPAEYALLGKVSTGQDVVDLISAVPTDGEMPVDPVVVRAVKITTS